MKYYVVGTNDLNCYLVNENFEITQLDSRKKFAEHDFSGQWKLKGFQPVRSNTVLNPLELLGKDLKFKNGNGKYYVVDIDYGTTRVWSRRLEMFYEVREEM